MRRGSAAVFVASIVLAAPARAENARASQLYTDAKALVASDKWAEACPMFEESQKLEPAIGTQYNLADCYAHTGKPATALAMFREVVKAAQLTNKTERQRAAEERIAALEKWVPKLTIHVAKTSTTTVIQRDGATVEPADFDKPMPVDPGAHVVTASAAGHLSWERRVVVGEGAMDVDVPALTEVARPRPSPLRWVGAAVAGVGVIGLGVGTVFGIIASGKKSDAGCEGVDCSQAPPGSADTLRDAQTSATVSTIFFIAGGALAAGGAALFFLAPKEVKVGATVAPGTAALTIGRAF